MTGPKAFFHAINTYEAVTGQNVTILEAGHIYPYDWSHVSTLSAHMSSCEVKHGIAQFDHMCAY